MSYYRFSVISGFDTTDDPPKGPDNYHAIDKFYATHYRVFVMSGHWKAESALRFARRHRIVSDVRLEHKVSDMSGHGRGGIDACFRLSDTETIVIPVSQAQDEDQALMDLEDVWSDA